MSECNCNDIIIEIPTENIVIEMTPEGKDGTDGNGIADIVLLSEVGLVKTYRINYTDGSHYDYTVTDGAQGEPGPQGEEGPEGPEGPQGEQGEPGPSEWGVIEGDIANQTDLADALDSKAPAIVATASGSIVSIPDGTAQPVLGLSVNVEPVQDLHGFDSPWPAGGGKNLLSPTEAFTITHNGITFTGDGNGTYTISGTSTGTAFANIPLTTPLVFPDKNMYFHVRNNVANGNVAVVLLAENEATQLVNKSTSTINMVSTAQNNYGNTAYYLRLFVNGAGVEVNMTVSPMILDTNSADKFYPYSNICPISGHTQAKVTRTGKNLFNPVTLELGTFTGEGLPSSAKNRIRSGFIRVEGGKSYALSADYNTDKGTLTQSVSFYPENTITTKRTGFINWTTNNIFQVPLGTNYIRCLFQISSQQLELTDISNVQFELGSTATSYEPYQGTQITIDLDGTRYGGVVDVTNGTLTVNRAEHTIIANEVGLGWNNQAYSNISYAQTPKPNNAKAKIAPNFYFWICDSYVQTNSTNWDSATHIGQQMPRNGNNYWWYGFPYGTSLEDMRTALTGVRYIYELAEPITVTLTPQQLTLLLGDNNVWADTGDVSITYHADTGRYIDSKLADLKAELQALILES